MTDDEAYDCGAWASYRNLGRGVCPGNFFQAAAWQRGYTDQPGFTKEQMSELKIRKTGTDKGSDAVRASREVC